MKKLISLILMMILTSAFAGEKGGNGGDGVVCRTPQGEIKSTELLDFYEARVLRDLKPELLSTSKTFEENLEILLQTLGSISPVRAALYRSWNKTFFEEAKMLRGQTLEDVPDSEHLSLPQGCGIEQLVIQQTPRFPQDKRYLINADLWDALPTTSQAGLIFHELLLREIKESYIVYRPNPIHTQDLRYLHSLVASGSMKYKTLREFNTLTASLRFFNYVEATGLSRLIHKLSEFEYVDEGSAMKTFMVADRGGNPASIYGPTTFPESEDMRFYEISIRPDESFAARFTTGEIHSVELLNHRFRNYAYKDGRHTFIPYKNDGDLNSYRTGFGTGKLVLADQRMTFTAAAEKFIWNRMFPDFRPDTCPDMDVGNMITMTVNLRSQELEKVEFPAGTFMVCGLTYTFSNGNETLEFENNRPVTIGIKFLAGQSVSNISPVYFEDRKIIATTKSKIGSFLLPDSQVKILDGSEISGGEDYVEFTTAERTKVCDFRKCRTYKPGSRVRAMKYESINR